VDNFSRRAVQIEILYFAVFRERLRLDGERLDLPAGATVAEARAALAAAHPEIAPLLPRAQSAVNRTMVGPEHTLRDGDELALIPPVAGGSADPKIALSASPLSLAQVIAAVEGPEQGGIVTFTGAVRRQGQQPNVARLEYEAYGPMAEQVLTAIASEIEGQWPGVRVAIHHRTGVLLVGEIAVAIAVSAPHRAEAFDACRAAIDRLKQRAPIWKKEIGDDGAVWVGLGP
jgi:molybdopterin synthase catalytic subunit